MDRDMVRDKGKGMEMGTGMGTVLPVEVPVLVLRCPLVAVEVVEVVVLVPNCRPM